MGPSGDRLGVMLGHPGPSWSDVVPVSGHVGAILGLYVDIWSRLGTIRGRIKITQKPHDVPGFSHSGPCLKGCSGIIELFFVIT